MGKSEQNISKKKIKSFDKNALTIVHQLHPYVKQRLRVVENLGIIPKNMYQSNEIIDEVILIIYENKNQEEIDFYSLRMTMFTEVNKKLIELFDKEKWHKNSISTKIILEEELKQLEENFTMDADNDLIMNEDLDDISYHQNDHELHGLPYDDAHDHILSLLEIQNEQNRKRNEYRTTIRSMYKQLPLQTSNVVDLYVLGKLNIQEIAQVLDTEIIEVKRIIDFVKENFKKYLN